MNPLFIFAREEKRTDRFSDEEDQEMAYMWAHESEERICRSISDRLPQRRT